MKPILFVTPNPSIDKVLMVPNYHLGRIHRPQQSVRLAGGKGLNAARTARLLGATVQACILAGGHSGKWLVEQLEKQDQTLVHVSWIQTETRTCTVVADPEHRQLTEVYEYGEAISIAVWERFEKLFSRAIEEVSLVVFSGSLPPGAPPDGYARMIHMAHDAGVASFLDTHGHPLELALKAQPYAVKVNRLEAASLLNTSLKSLDEVKMAARRLLEWGIDLSIITLGKEGAIAASGEDAWVAEPPPVDAYLSVGSGDAMMGALAISHIQDETITKALQLGIAAGLANALTVGAGCIEPDVVAMYEKQVRVLQETYR